MARATLSFQYHDATKALLAAILPRLVDRAGASRRRDVGLFACCARA
jgi:hypothetical protein